MVRERRGLDEDGIYPALLERHRVVVQTTRLRDTPAADLPAKRDVLAEEAVHLLRLLAKPVLLRRKRLFVCSAGHWSCLAYARLLRIFGRRPCVFAYNFYLHGLSRNVLVRALLRGLLGRHVTLLVQSEEDERFFRGLSERVKIELVPYCQDPIDVPAAAIGDNGYIFAGGYTNRDYGLVLRVASRLPDVPFVIACSRLNDLPARVPVNVEIRRDLGWDAFHEALAGARAVLVPLRERVGSSGQMVTLAAMQLGKPTLVPDVNAVSQYVVPESSGVVYPLGDEDALVAALSGVLADRARLQTLGEAAKARYLESFTRQRFDTAVVARVLELAGSQTA